MQGLSRVDGRFITGNAHLVQSIQDILTTPLGTRVMRPDYGSRLFELIDAPMNHSTLTEIYAATAEALLRWEPRFKLFQIQSASKLSGKLILDLKGELLPEHTSIQLKGISV